MVLVPPFKCKKKARFRVGLDTARVIYPMTAAEVTDACSKTDALLEIGLVVDFIAWQNATN
jgi:hypothetical protein